MSGGRRQGDKDGALAKLERKRARLLAELRQVEAVIREYEGAGPDVTRSGPEADYYDPADTREYVRRFRAREYSPNRFSYDLRD